MYEFMTIRHHVLTFHSPFLEDYNKVMKGLMCVLRGCENLLFAGDMRILYDNA